MPSIMSVKRFSSTSIMNFIKVLHKKKKKACPTGLKHVIPFNIFYAFIRFATTSSWPMAKRIRVPFLCHMLGSQTSFEGLQKCEKFQQKSRPEKKKHCLFIFFQCTNSLISGKSSLVPGSPWQATKRPPFVLSLPKRPTFQAGKTTGWPQKSLGNLWEWRTWIWIRWWLL